MNTDYSYEIKPEVKIDAPISNVWSFLIEIENWWVKSNPDHKSLSINNSGKEIEVGTKITIEEKIAGIPCKAIGEISKLEPNRQIEWKAVYYLFGIKWIRVHAGVAWKLRSISSERSALMANVWAHFPNTLGYKFLWFFFKKIINGIDKDYEHAMTELKYIKGVIEQKDYHKSQRS